MDAKEFCKEFGRMCTSNLCSECPAKDLYCSMTMVFNNNDTRIVDAVEKWSKEHPRKTRQSVFLEQYPEAQMGAYGVLDVCPAPISRSYRIPGGGCLHNHKKCADCRREFWMKEVE